MEHGHLLQGLRNCLNCSELISSFQTIAHLVRNMHEKYLQVFLAAAAGYQYGFGSGVVGPEVVGLC